MALLSASRVSHYFGGLTAVSDFNLDLEPGELMGVIGPNGAGKTTVFNLLSGVYRASEGSIRFDGHEIIGKRSDQIAALGMARTFQNIRLFKDLTVLDNVRIACYNQSAYNPLEALFRIGRYHKQEREIAERSMDLLAIFNLENYAQDISQNLPYGLQRRLEIARALATGPKVLLLDEPAAGMNPNEVIQLMDLIQEIRRQFHLTILLIEHQMQLVMGICERLIVLDFGATIATGVPEAIKNNRAVLEAYLGEEVTY